MASSGEGVGEDSWKELEKAKREIEELKKERDNLHEQVTEFGNVKTQLKQAQEEVGDLRYNIQNLVTQLTKAQKDNIEELETRVGKSVDDASKGIQRVTTFVGILGTQLKQARKDVEDLRNNIQGVNTQLANANTGIKKLEGDLENEKTKSGKLGTENGELNAKLGTAEELKGKLDRDLATEKTKSGELERQLAEALKHNQRLTSRIEANNPNPSIKCSLVHIVAYFFLATVMCFSTSSNFTGMDNGNLFTNVLYFVVVTTLSVGYGDIYPKRTASKLLTCALVVYGAHISNCLIVVQSYICGKLKAKFPHNLSELQRKIITGILALGAVLISIFGGMLGIYLCENGKNVDKKIGYKLNATDSFYLSMMSLSTVGFGDFSFKTVRGRVFAVCWLLIFQPFYASTMRYLRKLVALTARHFFPGCF